MSVILCFDGGARPTNPGPAACAWVIYQDGHCILSDGIRIGHESNNVAEYTGLIYGLKAAAKLTSARLGVLSDSRLIVEQMRGTWRVRNPRLRLLHAEAHLRTGLFDDVFFEWVPREKNSRCDEICTELLTG